MQPTTRSPQRTTRHETTSLVEALELRGREHVALVGAGGKSTLLLSLAEELHRCGKRVLVSTTTRVWERQAAVVGRIRWIGRDESWRAGLRKDLEEAGRVFLGRTLLASGKVQGVDPLLLDEIYGEEATDYILVEADGSAGRPVKAPSGHEPVIPHSATVVVAVMGVEAMGLCMSPSVVFRPEAFERVTGVKPGERMTPLALARLFRHPEGLFKDAPAISRRTAFLNKADIVADLDGVRELSDRILNRGGGPVERVVIGSVRRGDYVVVRRENE